MSYGLLKIRPRVGTSPFLQTMGSVFDFPSMAAVAGAWFVWQNYLVNINVIIPQSGMGTLFLGQPRAHNSPLRLRVLPQSREVGRQSGTSENTPEHSGFYKRAAVLV